MNVEINFLLIIMPTIQTSFLLQSTILISGLTGCGKTRFVKQLLHNLYISPFLKRVILVYAKCQPDY